MKVAYYECPALRRIYTLAAWQATAQTLTDAFGIAPGAEALRALMQKLDAEPDDSIAREMVFWLGLSGRAPTRSRQSSSTSS